MSQFWLSATPHAAPASSQSGWEKLQPSSMHDYLHGQLEFTDIILTYQWNLFSRLQYDIHKSFSCVYKDLDALHKDIKRMDCHLRSLDGTIKLHLENSSLDSHIKDMKESNVALIHEIQNRLEKQTKHIDERIIYLGNYFQEWSQSAVAHLAKLQGNKNDDINNDYESSRTQSTISSSCFHNESTEPNLRRSEIQSSFSNSDDDKYSISTCTMVDEIPTKSNTRALSPTNAHIETSSLAFCEHPQSAMNASAKSEAVSTTTESLPSISTSDECHPQPPCVYSLIHTSKRPTKKPRKICKVHAVIGENPYSRSECSRNNYITGVLKSRGVCTIAKTHIPAGSTVRSNHVTLPVNFPNAALLSQDKRKAKILQVSIDFQVIDHESQAAFSIGVNALKTHRLKVSFDEKGVVVTGITNDSHAFRLPVAEHISQAPIKANAEVATHNTMGTYPNPQVQSKAIPPRKESLSSQSTNIKDNTNAANNFHTMTDGQRRVRSTDPIPLDENKYAIVEIPKADAIGTGIAYLYAEPCPI